MTPDLKAPEGCVILGYGGTFKVKAAGCALYTFDPKRPERGWLFGRGFKGRVDYLIYAAAADSEVARMNSPEKPEGSETPRTIPIKRWDLDRSSCGPDEMRRDATGRFVRYDDHLSELAARDALIGELRDALQQIRADAKEIRERSVSRVADGIAAEIYDRATIALRRADGKEGA